MCKDVSNTIKTTISYPSKLALDKISYEIFFKIGPNYEKVDNFGQVALLFDMNLNKYPIIIICSYFTDYKFQTLYGNIFFGDITDDASDDVNNDLVPRVKQ